MTIRKEIGNRLRVTREGMGISQVSMADQAAISLTTWRKYERGVTTPTADILREIALILNVSADWLLCLTPPKEPGEEEDFDV